MKAVVYDINFPTIIEWMQSLVSSGILQHSPFPVRSRVRYALTKNGVVSVYETRELERIWIADYLATDLFRPEIRIGLPYRNLMHIAGDRRTYQIDCDTVDPDTAPFCADLNENDKQRLREGITTYPLFQIMCESESGRFEFSPMGIGREGIPIIGLSNLSGPEWDRMIEGRGMLVYGFERDVVTSNIPELQGEPAPVIREEDNWLVPKKIEFIFDCTRVVLERLRSSRREIEQENELYKSESGAGGKWDFTSYYQELLRQARLYKSIVDRRDFLQTLVDAKSISAVSLVLRAAVSISWAVEEQQASELAHEIEQILIENPIRIEEAEDTIEISNLVQFVAYWERQIRELNAIYPFLAPGRVGYKEILEEGVFGAEAVKVEILNKLEELLSDNQQAQDYMADDRENIQSPLRDLHPYKVLILPGVSEQMIKEHREDWRYILAAYFLMGDQTAFQVVMTVSEIFASIFFPPLGVALGIYNAALQIDEAVFADAISDATLNVDDAYLSQAEARSRAIWAGVAAGFSAFDALGAALRTGGKIASISRTSPIDEIDGVVDDAAAQTARAVQQGGKTVDRVPEIADLSQHVSMLRRNLTVPHERWYANILGEPDIISRLRLVRDAEGKIPVLSAYRRYYRQMIESLERLPEAQRGARAMPMSVDEFVRSWTRRRPFIYGRRRLDLLEAAARESDALSPFEVLRVRAGKNSLRELFGDVPALRRALRDHMDTLAKGSDEYRIFEQISDELSSGTGPVRNHISRFRYLGRNLPAELRANSQLVDDLARIENIQSWLPSGASADVADEAAEAFRSVSRLMQNPEIDPRLVSQILNNPNLRGNGRRWAIILDRLQGAEGFINRVAHDNTSLLEAMVRGNRGHAFEAIVSSRVDLRYVEQISLGNRFRLNGSMLEADLLVRFRDGKQLLIDAKFWEPGSRFMDDMVNHALRQMRKMHRAIMDPNIKINAAEFWVSHSAEKTMKRYLRRRLAKGGKAAKEASKNIRIVTDVIAEDWTEWFLRTDVPLTWTDFDLPLLGHRIPLGPGGGD